MRDDTLMFRCTTGAVGLIINKHFTRVICLVKRIQKFTGGDFEIETMGLNGKVMGCTVDGIFPHVQESIDEHNNPNNG